VTASAEVPPRRPLLCFDDAMSDMGQQPPTGQPGPSPAGPPTGAPVPPAGPPLAYAVQPGAWTGQQPGYPAQPPMSPDDEKLWAIAAHIGPVLLGFVAPLVVWLVFRQRSAYLDRQGKEALNFQLTVLIGYVACFVLAFVLIGLVLLPLLWVLALVFQVIATIKVANREDYRYPVNIRFVS
jgi:uncharacterized Tic20 family protein